MRLFFAICCLGFALPAVAQLDSYALHAKYGSPLNRETFHLPAGFDLVVDYRDHPRLQNGASGPATLQGENF